VFYKEERRIKKMTLEYPVFPSQSLSPYAFFVSTTILRRSISHIEITFESQVMISM
jgi:hypothetical protein